MVTSHLTNKESKVIKVEQIDGVEIRTEYMLSYDWKLSGGGFCFPCDPQGNVEVESLNSHALQNYKDCISGKNDVVRGGVEEYVTRYRLCDCGSGEYPEKQYDARGIYLTSTCDQCEAEKLGRYRPDVLTDSNYWCDEPIDE